VSIAASLKPGHVLSARVAAPAGRRERVQDRLEGGVGHRADVVYGGAEVPERLHRRRPVLRVARVEHGYAEHRTAVQVHRDERFGRRGDHGAAGGHLVGRAVGPVAPAAQHLGRTIDTEHHQPGEHGRAERVQAELEFGDEAEVAAAAADAPEQVGVLTLAGAHDPPVGQHHLGRDEVVAGQAVLRRSPAVSAAGGETTEAGGGDAAARGVQPVRLGGGVELAP
jgi:hypothetical protein